MRVLRILIVVVMASLFGLAGMIAFGTASVPPPMASVTSPFRNVDFDDLPAVQRYPARDGVALAYRQYAPAALRAAASPAMTRAAVLIHGASASGVAMHPLAKELAAAGIAVFALDLRGHGENQPHGDLSYAGQFDDDIADFVRFAKLQLPGAEWSLVGFSAGGGLALRVDGSPEGGMFDRYLLLSPSLGYRAPTQGTDASEKEQAGGSDALTHKFVAPYMGRLIGLSILNRVGIHWFDGLPVIAFAVPADSKSFTQIYSMRLLTSFGPTDYVADIRNIHRPTAVVVGKADEFLVPEKFDPVIRAQRADVPVTIVPGLKHLDLITHPAGLAAVRDSLLQGATPKIDPER